MKTREFNKEYFSMNEEDAIAYSKEVLNFFESDADLTCKEIGDGNLNYVFRIEDKKNNKSVIIKQAGPVARISDDFKLSPDRNRIESEILMLQGKLTNGLAPKVYKYDPIMNCCSMEDLSDYIILRTALIEHRMYKGLANDLAEFLVRTLLLTSDVVMSHKEKKELVKNYINPELCEISEDLVYTEPFYDCERNAVFEEVIDFVRENIWEDKSFLLETAKLKFDFMNKAQSLIHGDLHSGSVFVKEDGTMVIDPEFAFYGPAGYDIGNVIAHFVFALANGMQTIDDEAEREVYTTWVKNTIKDTIDLFKEKFNKLWDEKATERVCNIEGFKEWYLNDVLSDTAAVAGMELLRRTIGLAHVKDITIIEDSKMRAEAEKLCMNIGKDLVMNRKEITSGEAYLDIIKKF